MKKGYLFIILTALIFSTAEPIFKSVSGIFNPVQFTATRFFFGGVFLLPFALNYLKKLDAKMKESGNPNGLSIEKRDVRDFIITGFLNVTFSMTLYQAALALIPASAAAVLLCTNPVFTTFIAYFLLKEPISKNKIASIILSLIGIFIIINPTNLKLNPMGVILMGFVIVSFSLYSVLGKKTTIKFGGLVANSFSSIAGGITSFVFIALTNIPVIAQFFAAHGLQKFSAINLFGGYTLAILPIVLWIWFFNTGIGFLSYFKGMELTSATEASIAFFIKIFLGPTISMIFLGERITGQMSLGFVFVLLGSLAGLLPGLIEARKSRKELNESA